MMRFEPMKLPLRAVTVSALAATFAGAWAGQTTVGVSAGYLAVTNRATGESNPLLGSIQRAQIDLFAGASASLNAVNPLFSGAQDKFALGPAGTSYSQVGQEGGAGEAGPDATAFSEGFSSVTGRFGYDVSWNNTSTANAPLAVADSGTFDPYTVTLADLQGAGAGSAFDLFFQNSLQAGSGISLSPDLSFDTGSITLRTYLRTSAGERNIWSIQAKRNENGSVQLSTSGDSIPGLELYLMNPSDVSNGGLTPAQRISGSVPLSLTGLQSLLLTDLQGDGDLDQTYYLGTLFRNFSLPVTPIAGTNNLFSLHTDSRAFALGGGFAGGNPVPEPATALALLPALLLLRRRSKR